jgi:hypothetical protein
MVLQLVELSAPIFAFAKFDLPNATCPNPHALFNTMRGREALTLTCQIATSAVQTTWLSAVVDTSACQYTSAMALDTVPALNRANAHTTVLRGHQSHGLPQPMRQEVLQSIKVPVRPTTARSPPVLPSSQSRPPTRMVRPQSTSPRYQSATATAPRTSTLPVAP